MLSSLPTIAIVGEPNVGKSTLLNKIAGRMFAVTSPVAGTTRDRQYVDTSWNGVAFTFIDTAGITYNNTGELESALNEQIDIAVDQADILLFVVDAKAGVQQIDRKTILKFRKSKKPVILAVNKVDSPKNREAVISPFQSLGIKSIFPVSALSGRGIGDMLDDVAETIKKLGLDAEEVEQVPGIAVSIVGKPNVGKSSILNRILKQERVIVSSIAGTTRTAIDTHTTIDGQDYTFIDTAGLKKKEHRQKLPDIYSGFQTFKAIRRSDICFLVIDATEEITKQDQHIAQEIFELDKGVIILANKYDLYKGDEQELRDYISHHFPFLWFCPLFFVSAKTGKGIDEAIAALKPIYENRRKEISQDDINRLLSSTLKQNPPKLLRDQKKPKVFGLNQVNTNPPIFELIVNYPATISQQYRKYVLKRIIKHLDFWGTPVQLKLRGKDKK
jgi:GTP-binding protein